MKSLLITSGTGFSKYGSPEFVCIIVKRTDKKIARNQTSFY
jgi:hypothetical protein